MVKLLPKQGKSEVEAYENVKDEAMNLDETLKAAQVEANVPPVKLRSTLTSIWAGYDKVVTYPAPCLAPMINAADHCWMIAPLNLLLRIPAFWRLIKAHTACTGELLSQYSLIHSSWLCLVFIAPDCQEAFS